MYWGGWDLALVVMTQYTLCFKYMHALVFEQRTTDKDIELLQCVNVKLQMYHLTLQYMLSPSSIGIHLRVTASLLSKL